MHDENVYYTLKFEGKIYVLDLFINDMLLPSSFTIAQYTESGKLTMHKPEPKVQPIILTSAYNPFAVAIVFKCGVKLTKNICLC